MHLSYHFQDIASYLSKVAIFPTPRVFGTLIWNAVLKSQEDLWCKKTTVPWLLCGVVCLMKYVLPFR